MAKTNTAVKPKSNGKPKPSRPRAENQPPPVSVSGQEVSATTEAIPSEPITPTMSNGDIADSIRNEIAGSGVSTAPTESIVQIPHSDLYPFKGHPFQLRDDDDMKALVASVKERGIDQPALVRPREDRGYELIAGHRRQHAAVLAGKSSVPCVIRQMNDDEAILAMTESNLNHRSEILPSERAKALKMQLDAIKHQGAKPGKDKNGELSRRSNEIVAERNHMSVKNPKLPITMTW